MILLHIVAKYLKCVVCFDALISLNVIYLLIEQKSNGGFIVPSEDVTYLCKVSDKCFSYYTLKYKNLNKISSNIPTMINNILRNCKNYLFLNLNHHDKNLNPLYSQKYSIAYLF